LILTRYEVKAYIKKHGKWPRGWARCMDCRCTGKGECAGEKIEYQRQWVKMMEEELSGRK